MESEGYQVESEGCEGFFAKLYVETSKQRFICIPAWIMIIK